MRLVVNAPPPDTNCMHIPTQPFMSPETLQRRLEQVRAQLAAACAAAGRSPGSVTLVAVSKGFPASALAQALSLGQRDFGENYLQEALPKLAALPRDRVTWHFQGPLQSNKTQDVAANFDWVHSVDRERIARRLSEQRLAGLAPLNVCVQVN